MVLPIWLIANWGLGVEWPYGDLSATIILFGTPIIATGVVLLWAFRVLQSDPDMPSSDKMRWIVSFVLLGVFAAFVFLRTRCPFTDEAQ